MNPDTQTINNDVDIRTVVDTPMGGKTNVILDATVLSTLMSCARLTDFRFNHNLISIGGKSNSLECGSIVHTFLEFYYKNRINGLNHEMCVNHAMIAAQLYITGCKYCTDFHPTMQVVYCCDEHELQASQHSNFKCDTGNCIIRSKPECGHKPNEFPGVLNTPKENEGNLIGWHYALDTCQEYADHNLRVDSWTPIETESVRAVQLYEDDEIRILWKAKHDVIMNTWSELGTVSCDHKTMKQNRPSVELNNQFMGQCFTTEKRVVFINKVGFQKSLKPEDKFKRVPINYSGDMLLEWQSEIVPFYAKLLKMYSENGYFPPNYTHCESKYGMCAFYEVCKSNPNMREMELKRLFTVGEEWNPTNPVEGE